MFYTVKYSLLIPDEQGQLKRKTEQALVRAVSVSDAEAKVAAEMAHWSEFRVILAGESKIQDVIDSPTIGDKCFWDVISSSMDYGLDPEKSKPKRVKTRFLVFAEDADSASAAMTEYSEIRDFTIESVSRSNISFFIP